MPQYCPTCRKDTEPATGPYYEASWDCSVCGLDYWAERQAQGQAQAQITCPVACTQCGATTTITLVKVERWTCKRCLRVHHVELDPALHEALVVPLDTYLACAA